MISAPPQHTAESGAGVLQAERGETLPGRDGRGGEERRAGAGLRLQRSSAGFAHLHFPLVACEYTLACIISARACACIYGVSPTKKDCVCAPVPGKTKNASGVEMEWLCSKRHRTRPIRTTLDHAVHSVQRTARTGVPCTISCIASVQPLITWLGANEVGSPRA